PSSVNTLDASGEPLRPGAEILSNGRIRIVSNNGVASELSIGLSAFTQTTASNDVISPALGFGKVQDAVGQGAVADFLVYDTLGEALNVRLSAVLEQRTGSATVYRWFADSANNDPS